MKRGDKVYVGYFHENPYGRGLVIKIKGKTSVKIKFLLTVNGKTKLYHCWLHKLNGRRTPYSRLVSRKAPRENIFMTNIHIKNIPHSRAMYVADLKGISFLRKVWR